MGWPILLISFFLLEIMGGFVQAADPPPLDLNAIAEKIRPSVVALKISNANGDEENGTGFIISRNENENNDFLVVPLSLARQGLEATTADGGAISIDGILARDETSGLALLQIKLPARSSSLHLVSQDQLPPGARVAVVCLSSSDFKTQAEGQGIIRNLPENKQISPLKGREITAPIFPRFIGAPVADENGTVVGAATMVEKDERLFALAIPPSVIKSLLTQAQSLPQPLLNSVVKTDPFKTDFETATYWKEFFSHDYLAAEKTMRNIILRIPASAEAQTQFGYTLILNRNWNDAQQTFNLAIQLKPDSFSAWAGLAESEDRAGKHPESASAAQHAFDLIHAALLNKPDFAAAWSVLANLYLQQHHYDKASDVINQLHKLDPSQADLLNQLLRDSR